jgi:hypothetical protein
MAECPLEKTDKIGGAVRRDRYQEGEGGGYLFLNASFGNDFSWGG